MSLGDAVAMVAPYYNLVLIAILFVLFFKLFSYDSKRFAYLKPWRLLFWGIVLFLVETVMTILKKMGMINYPWVLFSIFEMVIVLMFIYMVLLQKQFIKTGKKD